MYWTVLYCTGVYCAVMYVLHHICTHTVAGQYSWAVQPEQGHSLGPLPREHGHAHNGSRLGAAPVRVLFPVSPELKLWSSIPPPQLEAAYYEVHSHHCGSSEHRPGGVPPASTRCGLTATHTSWRYNQLGGASLATPGYLPSTTLWPHACARLGYRRGCWGRRTARRWDLTLPGRSLRST